MATRSEGGTGDAARSAPWAVLGVPSSAGARLVGQEEAPRALRAAGLVGRLRAHDATLVDRGDLARAVYRPDGENLRHQNVGPVRDVATAVAEAVRSISRQGALPLVLGGDCTVTLGVVAGLADGEGELGLVYFDGDLDLNTPETSPSGILDGMVTAHLTGSGHPSLTHLGSRCPALAGEQIVYLGYNERDGGIDAAELDALGRSGAGRIPIEEVRANPEAAARAALSALAGRAERVLVHFDLDVTDSPAVDVRHPHGLPLEVTAAALRELLASPSCAGLVFTEFNPVLDPDGSRAPAIAALLADALASASRPS